MSKQSKSEAIPSGEYSKIVSNVPVLCVDNIAYRINSGEPEVLLVKRTEQPAKGCLYPIGKGLKKNSFTDKWALEALLKETNLSGEVIRAFGLYEVIYSQSQNADIKNGLHNVCVAYLTRLNDGDLELDSTHSSFKWVAKKDITQGLILPSYTKTLLDDSEIFSRGPSDLDIPGTFKHRFLDYRKVNFSQFIAP